MSKRLWLSMQSELNNFLSSPSLRQTLDRGIVAIVVFVALLMAFGTSIFIYQTESLSWEDRQNSAAESAASTVDNFLTSIQGYMVLSGLLDSNYLRSHPQTYEEILQHIPALLELIRLDADGHVLLSANRNGPVLSNLFTIPQSSWFQQAKAGSTYLGEVQISSTNEPYLIMAIPAANGGVIAARLEMKMLWDLVSQIRFGKTGQSYIINTQGEIVASANPDSVLQRISVTSQPYFSIILHSTNQRWHGMYTNYKGEVVVGSSAAIPNTGWIIITEVYRVEAFSASRMAITILGGIGILSGIITISLMNRLLRKTILQPVQALRDGAEKIGNGDLNHRIPLYQSDEIGAVAGAFNEMAQRLFDREDALKQARDEAMQASQFKSRLLANVGHDLRTPINSILGYAEILRDGIYGNLDERQNKASARIVSNARRLLNLINSILDQSQIEAGKLTLHAGLYDPREILNAVRETLEAPIQTKGLELLIECAPDLPENIEGDQQRTQQIIFNLVENALKFTSKGSISVRMYLQDSHRWAIDVSDTGPGVPPDAQQLIFEPFQRVDNSTTREKGGVGLGLSIVKQLALLMGGDVFLSSEPGKGSTFTVFLPLP